MTVRRLSLFTSTVTVGDPDVRVFFTSTAPTRTRLHFRTLSEDEAVLVAVHYGISNRVDAYVGGNLGPVVSSGSTDLGASCHGKRRRDPV